MQQTKDRYFQMCVNQGTDYTTLEEAIVTQCDKLYVAKEYNADERKYTEISRLPYEYDYEVQQLPVVSMHGDPMVNVAVHAWVPKADGEKSPDLGGGYA